MFLISLLIYRFLLYQQERSSLKILYDKLSKQKQAIINAVKSAEVHGYSTISGIDLELEKKTGIKNDRKKFETELSEFEQAGLIKKVLVNKEDKPFYFWKSQVHDKFVF
jgi:hypothetical protein